MISDNQITCTAHSREFRSEKTQRSWISWIHDLINRSINQSSRHNQYLFVHARYILYFSFPSLSFLLILPVQLFHIKYLYTDLCFSNILYARVTAASANWSQTFVGVIIGSVDISPPDNGPCRKVSCVADFTQSCPQIKRLVNMLPLCISVRLSACTAVFDDPLMWNNYFICFHFHIQLTLHSKIFYFKLKGSDDACVCKLRFYY